MISLNIENSGNSVQPQGKTVTNKVVLVRSLVQQGNLLSKWNTVFLLSFQSKRKGICEILMSPAAHRIGNVIICLTCPVHLSVRISQP